MPGRAFFQKGGGGLKRFWKKSCGYVLAAAWVLASAANISLFHGGAACAGQTAASVLYLLVWAAAIWGLWDKGPWLAGLASVRLAGLLALLAAGAVQELYALGLLISFAVMLPYYGISSCRSLGGGMGQRLVFLILGIQLLLCLYGYFRQRKSRQKHGPAA